MKFLKQTKKLPIINLDGIISINDRLSKKRHGNLLPNSIRCIVCGPSNCGKTNLLLNLLFSPEGVFFENVYVFSKSLYQDKYKFLACVLSNIKGIEYFSYTENENVPHPNEIKPNSVMVFDDVACEKQTHIKTYFSMGRHNNIDTFYLCQTYSYIPKQLVRDNANLIVLFKQDFKNLRHIYNDHVNTDMTFNTFQNMCLHVWGKGKNKFIVIDKDNDVNKGRYRSGFDTFIKF